MSSKSNRKNKQINKQINEKDMMGAKQNPGGANPIINKKYFFFLVLQPEIFFLAS